MWLVIFGHLLVSKGPLGKKLPAIIFSHQALSTDISHTILVIKIGFLVGSTRSWQSEKCDFANWPYGWIGVLLGVVRRGFIPPKKILFMRYRFLKCEKPQNMVLQRYPSAKIHFSCYINHRHIIRRRNGCTLHCSLDQFENSNCWIYVPQKPAKFEFWKI